jgi:putative transposase
MVDTMGNLLHILVHAANRSDTKAGCEVAGRVMEKFPSIKAVSADEGYRGTFAEYVRQVLERTVEISKKIKDAWAVLPKRWVVERTFSWFGPFRRLAKDYEIRNHTEENFCRIAMIRLQLDRIC